ncbi:hypothetical protein EVAR_9633_1 [Eumeta japonica]|uniref:Uncharacterized protein n=1 Tax=Eumeta variegata TaxID=151549 RepID=A0A4C1TMA6_EUMVA|nr:hypothetical protein EVAR_9633_1 [Eumeta japonica]
MLHDNKFVQIDHKAPSILSYILKSDRVRAPKRISPINDLGYGYSYITGCRYKSSIRVGGKVARLKPPADPFCAQRPARKISIRSGKDKSVLTARGNMR